MDPRIQKLARNLVRFSTRLQKGEKVLIDIFGNEIDVATALVQEAYEVGAQPFVNLNNHRVMRALMRGANDETWQQIAKYDAARMRDMDAYIAIRAGENATELADVPAEQQARYAKYFNHVVHSEIRVKKTKWVVLRWPTPAMAQNANTSIEAFEDFYFNVCTMDYAQMDKAMDPLKELMDRTDKVRLVGPGTDLSFSIKGIGAVKCSGHLNIPDGECYSAPVRESVNGVLSYNTTTVYQGRTLSDVRLEFQNGKIVKATASATDTINSILDTDEGARYIGEFSLGFNPYILHPMKDTLFDEKIAGSFHFTPGQSYDDAWNGNKSAVHWDMVCIQRPEYGGGEVYFDDRLIRKDGIFVVPELEGLNPDKLKG